VQVKGKEEPLGIYESLEGEDEIRKELKIRTLPTFEDGLQAYLKGNIKLGLDAFSEIINTDPEDTTALRFLDRLKVLEKTGLPENWTGIDHMTEK